VQRPKPVRRTTRQREAVRAAFETAEHPLTAEELLHLAKKRVEGIGIATVYRTIKSLLDEGWLTTVEVSGETPRYEHADKEHHHHFLCRACERVFEAEGCEGGKATLTAPPGFRVEGHEVVLRGVCVECDGNPLTTRQNRRSRR
jgi:Fur family ferric uptake transcriptional regulator